MKKTYYYGSGDEEIFYNTDIDSAYEEIRDYDCDGSVKDAIGLEIVEMVKSKKSGVRWCDSENIFEPECGCLCDCYKPINGKNGICKYLSWSLIATGRKWEILRDYDYKKISSRRKDL